MAKDYWPGDGYIYLITSNDPMDTDAFKSQSYQYQHQFYMVLNYMNYVRARLSYEEAPTDYERFWNDLQAIDGDNVLMFYNMNDSFEEPIVNYMPDVIGIDWTFSTVSYADRHPDAVGHAAAAKLMLPHVQDFVDEVCASGASD
jgi:hypothetical protein